MIHEREADTRAAALAAFEMACPCVAGNPYIPHWPTPPQARFLGLHQFKSGAEGDVFEALYGGAAGGGKALCLNTVIPTVCGEKRMNDIIPGDMVFDEKGAPTKVVACSDVMADRPCFEVELRDGEKIVADADHRWLTSTLAERSSAARRTDEYRAKRRKVRPKKGKGKRLDLAERNRLTAKSSPPPPLTIKTTKDISKSMYSRGRVNHSIDVSGPLVLPMASLSIDPYVLGLWLGDGTSASGDITIAEREGLDALLATGAKVDQRRNYITYKVEGLRRLVKQGGLLKNKHLPAEYLRGSVDQRLAVLQGLCDSDGHAKKSGAVEFTTTSPRLRDGILSLLATLGIKARARQGRAKLNGKDCGPKWRVVFLTNLDAFRIPRKLAIQKRPGFRGTHTKRWVVAVRPVESVPVKCIQVESKSGMFLCGRSMLPTHNSDALLMAAAQYAWQHPDFAGIMFRRTHTDLAQPGALMDRAMEWWIPAGVHWDGVNKIFTFPSGAKVAMAYLKGPSDHLRYQGAEYQYTAWDELTQWESPRPYEYVGLSRVRRMEGSTIPLRTLSASNPGGPGHTWVKDRFIGGVDIVTGQAFDALHPYVPARIEDNPHLDRDAYIRTLERLHPTVRAQLLKGDWSAREPGDYFRVEWFGPMLDSEADAPPRGDHIAVRWWDLAASEKADAARTAGVLMARLRPGVRAVVHATAFRATPGKRDAKIVQQAHIDGRGVVVGIEIEGGSGGPAQFEALERRLKAEGFRVAGARPKVENADKRERKLLVKNPTHEKGKAGRADPVASCLERGHQRRGECNDTGEPWWGLDAGRGFLQQRDGLRLFAGPWTQAYLDEIEGFPDSVLLDLVDATSGAWAWLEAHPFGLRVAPEIPKPQAVGELASVHPEDRGSPGGNGRDRAGHWRP